MTRVQRRQGSGAGPLKRGEAGRRLSLSVPYRPPFLAGSLLAFFGDRAIAGVEEVEGSTLRRSLATDFGWAVLELTPLPTEGRAWLDAEVEDRRARRPLVRAARALFDLDADPEAIEATLGRDPLLRPLVRRHRGIRVPGAADGLELVVRAIIGQQVSVRAARTMLGRIAAAYGVLLPHPGGGVRALFPSVDRLADASLERLGVTSRRATAIRRVASMVASSELDLSGRSDADATVGALLALDGIGPWTAEYVRMRALRDRDAFPAGDLGVRRAIESLGADPSLRSLIARAEAWRPWRAYATMLLWQELQRPNP